MRDLEYLAEEIRQLGAKVLVLPAGYLEVKVEIDDGFWNEFAVDVHLVESSRLNRTMVSCYRGYARGRRLRHVVAWSSPGRNLFEAIFLDKAWADILWMIREQQEHLFVPILETRAEEIYEWLSDFKGDLFLQRLDLVLKSAVRHRGSRPGRPRKEWTHHSWEDWNYFLNDEAHLRVIAARAGVESEGVEMWSRARKVAVVAGALSEVL